MDDVERTDFESIAAVWRVRLWPERQTVIEPTSAIGPDGEIQMAWKEAKAEYWWCRRSNEVAACGSILILGESARLRGLWVDENLRGEGLGRKMFDRLSERARAAGAREIWTMARLTAAPFYESCGMVPGASIVRYEYGPHRMMSLRL